MKTTMSRFQIHDDLTAPDGSLPVLRGALASGGQLPNFLGVLAGSPAALPRAPKAALAADGNTPMYLHEEARELGWDDEQLLEAIAFASLEVFTAMINVAGEIPI